MYILQLLIAAASVIKIKSKLSLEVHMRYHYWYYTCIINGYEDVYLGTVILLYSVHKQSANI